MLCNITNAVTTNMPFLACGSAHHKARGAYFLRLIILFLFLTWDKNETRGMAPVTITEDYYFVLKVDQSATTDAITKSYRKLALELHPDRNRKHDATEAFQLVC